MTETAASVTGLIAFIMARLDEDERLALAAGEDDEARHWTGGHNGTEGSGVVYDGHGKHVVYDEGRPDTAQALHIGMHDPARVLYEVEAKRQITAAHKSPGHHCPLPAVPGQQSRLRTPEDGACWTLHLLASAWSDHPGYCEAAGL